MIHKILRHVMTVLILSLVLFTAGFVIWFFMKESLSELQDVLFWVGAVPIVIFSIAKFGHFSGRGDTSYQLSRSVSRQSSNQRSFQDLSNLKNLVGSELHWIAAGLVIWLLVYLLYIYSLH